MTEFTELEDEEPKSPTVAIVVKREADKASSGQSKLAASEDFDAAELERWKSGDIVQMTEKSLRAYRSKRATIKDLNDLFERGYRLLMKGATSSKATPNVKNFSELMIKVKRMFADARNVKSVAIVRSLRALYGVEYSWHAIHDNQLVDSKQCYDYVESVFEDVPGSSDRNGDEFHVSSIFEGSDCGICCARLEY